jgi:hypothetical protein
VSVDLYVLRTEDDLVWWQWAVYVYQEAKLYGAVARGWDDDDYGE